MIPPRLAIKCVRPKYEAQRLQNFETSQPEKQNASIFKIVEIYMYMLQQEWGMFRSAGYFPSDQWIHDELRKPLCFEAHNLGNHKYALLFHERR